MTGNQVDKPAGAVFELLDFYATWCEPCKMLDGILEKVGDKLGKRLNINKIDIDQHPALKSRYQVMSVPVLVLLRDGRPVWRMNGFLTAPELIDIIGGHLEN